MAARFCSAPGQSFFLAVFVDDLIRDTDLTRTGFAAGYAAATIASAVIVLAVGRALDRWGVRSVWFGIAGGLGAGCLGLAFSTAIPVVVVLLCAVRGLGQGSFPLVGTVLVAASFEERRGRAAGIASLGNTLAGAVMPAVAVALIAGLGWRVALAVVGVALMVVVLPLGALADRRRHPQRREPAAKAGGLDGVLRRPGAPSLMLLLAAAPLVSTAIVVHAVSVLGAAGLPATAAAAALTVMAVVAAGTSLAAGAIADRTTTRLVLAPIGAALASAAVLIATGSPLGAISGMAFLGVASGVSSVANATTWARTYGTRDIGRLQSAAASAQIGAAALGPLPLAISHASTGGYRAGLAVLAVLAALAAVGAWRWGTAQRAPAGHGLALAGRAG